jgi:hypothetical protein
LSVIQKQTPSAGRTDETRNLLLTQEAGLPISGVGVEHQPLLLDPLGPWEEAVSVGRIARQVPLVGVVHRVRQVALVPSGLFASARYPVP